MSEFDVDVDEQNGEALDISDRNLDTQESIEDGREKFKKMIHNILGMGESSSQVEKICCFFRVNKKHSLSHQLILEYFLFLTLFMSSIIGFLVFYSSFSPKYVGNSILDVIDSTIRQSYQNSLLEYSKEVFNYLSAFSSWMITFSKIFSAHAGWDKSLYSSQSQAPLLPQGKYFRAWEQIPEELKNKKYSNSSLYFNRDISLKTFSYYPYLDEDQIGLSNQTKELLESFDILSYFYSSFFFDPTISNVYSLFMFFEERNTVAFFPAGVASIKKSKEIDSKSRPWYQNSYNQFIKNGNVSTLTITGPYLDATANVKIITYSLSLVNEVNIQINCSQIFISYFVNLKIHMINKPSQLAGIINVDVTVTKYQSVFEYLHISDNQVNIALVDMKSELIINNCFNSSSLITFYQTNETGFSLENWNDIKNVSLFPIDSTFQLTSKNNTVYYFAREFISKENTQQQLLLIIFGTESKQQSYRKEVQQDVDSTIFYFSMILIIILGIIWFIGYIFIFFFSIHIAKPLSKLSQFAKGVNKNDKQKRNSENLKNQLINVKGADKDTQDLINAFINLVDQHSGVRKRVKTAMYSPAEQMDPNAGKYFANNIFPLNEYEGKFDFLKEEISKLKNFDQNCQAVFENSQDIISNYSEKNSKDLPKIRKKNTSDEINSEEEGEHFNEISMSGLSENDPCLKNEYYYKLKLNIISNKNNSSAKLILQKQILNAYLPENFLPF